MKESESIAEFDAYWNAPPPVIYSTRTLAEELKVSHWKVWKTANLCELGFMVGKRRFFTQLDADRMRCVLFDD